jgi:hypothetical protein
MRNSNHCLSRLAKEMESTGDAIQENLATLLAGEHRAFAASVRGNDLRVAILDFSGRQAGDSAYVVLEKRTISLDRERERLRDEMGRVVGPAQGAGDDPIDVFRGQTVSGELRLTPAKVTQFEVEVALDDPGRVPLGLAVADKQQAQLATPGGAIR